MIELALAKGRRGAARVSAEFSALSLASSRAQLLKSPRTRFGALAVAFVVRQPPRTCCAEKISAQALFLVSLRRSAEEKSVTDLVAHVTLEIFDRGLVRAFLVVA